MFIMYFKYNKPYKGILITTGAEEGVEGEGVPCVVVVHGESYEWGAGNAYDGTALAAHGNIIVATINFRLGVLGKYK